MAGMKGISRVLGRVRGSRGGLDMAGLTGGGMGIGMDMIIIMMVGRYKRVCVCVSVWIALLCYAMLLVAMQCSHRAKPTSHD